MMGVEEQLAEIAERIVAFRTRDAKLDVARRLVETTGSASADEIAAALAEWQPPSGQELADLVARKTEAAVAVAEGELQRQESARIAAAEKAVKFHQHADEAQAVADAAPDDGELVAARELLAAALAAGGVPGNAPVGRSIAATPMRAEG